MDKYLTFFVKKRVRNRICLSINKNSWIKMSKSRVFFIWIEFSVVRAKCLRLSRELYKLHLCKIESNINNNLRCFWSYVYRFKKNNSLPQSMYLRDRFDSGRRSVFNLLADHFSSVFVNKQLAVTYEVPVNNILISMQIDEQELLTVLNNLDDSIMSGRGGIPP